MEESRKNMIIKQIKNLHDINTMTMKTIPTESIKKTKQLMYSTANVVTTERGLKIRKL